MTIKISYLLIFFFFLSLSFVFYSGCIDLMGGNGAIQADKLSNIPQDSVNLTSENMRQFPHLMQAFNSSGQIVEVPGSEWYAMKDFFKGYSRNVTYEGAYYRIHLSGII